MENAIRPLDVLARAKGKKIEVALKNSEKYSGKLKAFDIHLNLVLFEAKELSENKEIGDMVIRGDAIVTIKGI